MRAIVGRPVLLTLEVDDGSGQPTDADGAVTVTVTAGDGTTQVATGTATDVDTVGLYTWQLPPQAQLDTLDVTWSFAVGGEACTVQEQVRIVGQRLLSPQDIRRDSTLSKLAQAPDERRVLAEVLDAVEDLFADALGYPATLEGARVNFDAHRGTFSEAYAYGTVAGASGGTFTGVPGLGFGFGGDRLIVPGINRPQDVYNLWINGLAVPSDVIPQFRAQPGFLVWSGGRSWPSGNYEMWLTHGLKTVPGDLRWAAAKFASYVAKRTPKLGDAPIPIPERAASITGEGGTIVFAVPTEERPTGLPEVDAVLYRYALADVV